jgi:hypothetical protein
MLRTTRKKLLLLPTTVALGRAHPFNPAHEEKLEFGLEEPDGAIVASKRNDPQNVQELFLEAAPA